MRRFVLGDTHGNHKALIQVLKKSKLDYKKDILIVIGDIVDGYSCSYECVEELIKIKNLIFIIGNHDVFFMNHIANGWAESVWLMQGGRNTRKSYESKGYYYGKFPENHKKFFNNGVFYYELDDMLFVHGGFAYPKHPKKCTSEEVTWDRDLIEKCKNGLKIKKWKKIFVGHTTTENQGAKPVTYQQKNYGKLIQVDCGAGWGGRLCLYNIDTDDYFLSGYARILNKGEQGR